MEFIEFGYANNLTPIMHYLTNSNYFTGQDQKIKNILDQTKIEKMSEYITIHGSNHLLFFWIVFCV